MSDAVQEMLRQLNVRRERLGMSQAALARRSGLALPTVQRLLAGKLENASLGNVVAVAAALGLYPQLNEQLSVDALRERQAEQKARELVGMVQSTCGLESQAVAPDEFQAMIRRTVHELLAGSNRRLWAA